MIRATLHLADGTAAEVSLSYPTWVQVWLTGQWQGRPVLAVTAFGHTIRFLPVTARS